METEAAEREKMYRDRQANQRRLLIAKAHMEEELEKMRIFNDFGRLQKMLESGKAAGGAGGKGGATGRPATAGQD